MSRPLRWLLGGCWSLWRTPLPGLVYGAVFAAVASAWTHTLLDLKAARLLPSGEVKVSVVDDGLGVAPEHIPRLTERFYRVDKSRSRVQGGTGLGLAIVKHILGAHERQLVVESSPGRGSTFGFTLPTVAVPVERELVEG